MIPQTVKISDFSLFAGSNNNLPADSSNYGITFFSVGKVFSGNVGSRGLIQLDYNNQIYGNVYSNHRITLGDTGQIYGNIIANNFTGSAAPAIVSNNTSTNTFQNVIAQGNISLNINNSVKGQVSIPQANTYTGPTPQGGTYKGSFGNVPMPVMPLISPFNPGSGVINTTTTISPGSYKSIELSGGQTVTFAGPGDYYFDSIRNLNTGGPNIFNYDFLNTSTGLIRIIILQHAELGQIQTTTAGGDGSRIYTEVQGVGVSGRRNSFTIDGQPGGSNWKGTVWAPYGGIYIGTSYGQGSATTTMINGALWSGFYIYLDKAVFVYHVPLATNQNSIAPYYPPPLGGKVYDVIDASLESIFENYDPTNPPSDTDFVYRSKYAGEILIEVIAKAGQYTTLRNLLVGSDYGFRDSITNGGGSLVLTGSYPVKNLLKLNLPPIAQYIDYVKPLYLPLVNGGLAETLGDSSMRAGITRRSYNVTGSGIRIGVLSDSYARAAANPLTAPLSEDLGRDLPIADSIQILEDYFTRGSDEGRAMMHIIHDVAPGARLAFKTGFISPGDMALGIRRLATEAQSDIIVEDVTHITEPFFKDGVIARAVDDVAINRNVTYFSSAGNFGKKAFDGQFTGIAAPSGFTGLAHNFGPGNYLQPVTLKPGDYTIVLQWDDKIYSLGELPGAVNDLDIFLLDNAGNLLFGFNRVNIGRDPIEVLPFTVNGTEDRAANIMIVGAAGTPVNLKFKFVVFRGRLTFNNYAGASTLVGQANSANAIAVGAVKYNQTPAFEANPSDFNVEPYSSVGGTKVNGVDRSKPDLTAPDGVNVRVYMGPDTDGYAPPLGTSQADNTSNFYGTSAAAPHAAAVAALIKEAKQKFTLGSLTPAQLKVLLKNTAVQMGGSAYTPEAGAGLINAESAMSTFANPLPFIGELHVVEPAVVPGTAPFTVSVQGEDFKPGSVIYFAGHPLPTTFVSPEQITAPVPEFTGSAIYPGNPAIEVYNPPLVNGNMDGGYSDKRYFFETAKKNVVVAVQGVIRKFGERNPAFQVTITVDGQPLIASGLSAGQLKLNHLTFSTGATNSSSIGQYSITVANPLDPNNLADQLLLGKYNYRFIDAQLQIQKLPLTITPQSFTMAYGQFPNQIAYDYSFDRTAVSNPDSLVQALRTQHKQLVADNALAVLSGYNTVIPAISSPDIANMSMMASYQSFRNARKFTLQDDRLIPLTAAVANDKIGVQRYLIDLSAQSINDYKNNDRTLVLTPAYPGGPLRGLANSRIVADRHVQTVYNGQTLTLLNADLLTNATGELLLSLGNGQTLTLSNNGSLVPLNYGELLTSSDNVNFQALANGQLAVRQDGQIQLVQSVTVTASGEVLATLSNGQTLTISNGELITLINGELVTISNNQLRAIASNQLSTLANGQTLTLSNGQTLTLSNGDVVTLANGQTLTLANNELAALFNGQTLTLSNTQTLVFTNGQTLTLSNGQTLTLSNGQTLTLSNGQTLTLSNGQTLTLSNGQTLTLSNSELTTLFNGQTLTLSNGQTLTLSNGQTLTISNGQTLTLSNGQTLTLSNGEPFVIVNGQVEPLGSLQINASGSSVIYTLINGQTLTLSNSGEVFIFSNGELISISNSQLLSLSNGQTLTLSNTELLALSKGQTLTLSNGQTLTLSNGQTLTLSITPI
ncbi:hypothetical protein SAE01_14660 [Segetibacter aerophilus]|uniref:Peptidase S8/S53 domain-containing protein n=1 Tax=Segetibacter aerophilus TaxID=670293 RepID=A0A512BAJ1_9BACT|nr:hypothetical protein SAE01_14660 [Segetibacter aerophilus]